MENTFEPTVRHTTLLRLMNDQTKTSLKQMMDSLGYYYTIQFLLLVCNKSDTEARILADIGCYMIN